MTWDWLVLIGIVAFWTLGMQAIHSWKEVRMMQNGPEDTIKEMTKHAA